MRRRQVLQLIGALGVGAIETSKPIAAYIAKWWAKAWFADMRMASRLGDRLRRIFAARVSEAFEGSRKEAFT